VLPAGHQGAQVPPFKTSPAGLREVGGYVGDPPRWQVIEDVIDGSVTVLTSEYGTSTLPDGITTLYSGEQLTMTARDADPADATMTNEVTYRLNDGSSTIEVNASGRIGTTASDFEMWTRRQVLVDGKTIHEREWQATIPRRLV
jgi:hypothetical protein